MHETSTAMQTIEEPTMQDFRVLAREILDLHFTDSESFRLCLESASWESSKAGTNEPMRMYYHCHIQHDLLPGFSTGIGHHSITGLLYKLEYWIVPEILSELTK